MSTEENVQDYTISALSAITFKLVFTKENLEKKSVQCNFKPEMAHQVFGDKEIIFGYKDLSIDLYYLHNSSKCFVDMNYSDKVKAYEADDVMDMLNSWLPTNYVSTIEEFEKHLDYEKHDQIFGTVIHQFEGSTKVLSLPNENITCQYKITQCDLKDELFQDYHQRFETFIIWYIDAANFIDLSDERWLIFYIYEEYIHPKTKETIITPVGYTTIYKFYSYPSSNRARISQFFILPIYQGKGLGTELYKAVYNNIVKDMPDVIDITVEEPSSTFQSVRDICDAVHIYRDLETQDRSLVTKSPKILNKYMAEHKISKKQAGRLSDILSYYTALKSGKEEVESFSNNLLRKMKVQVEREFETHKIARGFRQENPEGGNTFIEETLNARYSRYVAEIRRVAEKLQKFLESSK